MESNGSLLTSNEGSFIHPDLRALLIEKPYDYGLSHHLLFYINIQGIKLNGAAPHLACHHRMG